MNFTPSLHTGQQLTVALDIGSHSVKVCELKKSGKGLKLNKLGSAVLPEGVVVDGEVQDPEAVTAIIINLFKNLKIKNKKVGFSISGYSVILKRINLTLASDQDLDSHIYSEAEQYIPFDVSEVYLDYQDISNTSTRKGQTDVMLVAARKEVVDAYLDILRNAGLKTALVDVDAFALENSYETNCASENNVLLVDIGASTINLNVVSGGSSLYARDASTGSGLITEQIQERCGVSPEEAESFKVGLKPVPEELRGDVEEIFVDAVNDWLKEVQKAIDFHGTNHPETKLDKIVLSGGGSKIEGLDILFRKETGLPVEYFYPFAGVQADDKKIDPEYLKTIAPEMAIAMGMASRTAPF
ncbi:MAG: type IV pilus assembly protein PilM [Desulfurivibrionaceae bacterium]